MMPSKDEINAALDRIIDPELGRGLVQLGLVHSVEIDDNIVHVDLQLTSPACPFSKQFIAQVKRHVGLLSGVDNVEVELVWPRP